jgi:hypothetical protein
MWNRLTTDPPGHSTVDLTGPFIGGTRSVAVQHRAVLPTHQPEHGVVVGAGQAEVVRGGVAELVDVDVPDPGLERVALDGTKAWPEPAAERPEREARRSVM